MFTIATPPPVAIIGRSHFIDAVYIHVRGRRTAEHVATLAAECGSCRWEKSRLRGWQYRLCLYQPSTFALEYVEQSFAPHTLINQIEFANDFVTGSEEDARELQRFIDARLVQPWRRNRRIGAAGATSYGSSRRWVSRQLVTYADRPSKSAGHFGRPCLHVELRVCTARAVRALGIRRPSDLLGMSHAAIWRRVTRLAEIDLDALERCRRRASVGGPRVRKGGGNGPLDRRAQRCLADAVRVLRADGKPARSELSAQEIFDGCKFDIRPAVKQLDVPWFWPAA